MAELTAQGATSQPCGRGHKSFYYALFQRSRTI
nr:MAG TPA: hypothetical protein [Caudoviricetes sp.]